MQKEVGTIQNELRTIRGMVVTRFEERPPCSCEVRDSTRARVTGSHTFYWFQA